MRSFTLMVRRFLFPNVIAIAALLAISSSTAIAQTPGISPQQLEMLNTMSPEQLQTLFREMQRNMPAAQREAIIQALQQEGATREQSLTPGPVRPTGESGRIFEEDLFLTEMDEEEVKFEPGDWLALEIVRREDAETLVSGRLVQTLDDLERNLRDQNPYQLDKEAKLLLPGVSPIALGGLSVDEAAVRLNVEPLLRAFDIIVTRLPLAPVGLSALEPFGHEIFKNATPAQAAIGRIAAPVDYVVGPGDAFFVQLFGRTNRDLTLRVSPEGAINFPEIGPINVTGLTYDDVRSLINDRVAEQMIGVRVSVTLSDLRTIRVFVLGEVERPGTYSLSSLSTITNALTSSGGLKRTGSLRNISLQRGGETIGVFDLYDFLLRGDTRGDIGLMAGDAIFVAPVGPEVAIAGEVRRPAIYEIRNERAVNEIIELAGGATPAANLRSVRLFRVVPNRGTTVIDADLTSGTGGITVRGGDVVEILPNLSRFENSVQLVGNVQQEGRFQWREGMRLRDLLPGPDYVRPRSDLGYVLIQRQLMPNVDVDVISVDIRQVWAGNESENIALRPEDIVHVFNTDSGRQQLLGGLLAQLQVQTLSRQPIPTVRVGGQVREEGVYPLERDMRVSDLIRAGGGLMEGAYTTTAELARFEVVDGEYREIELITVDLQRALAGDVQSDLRLSPHDFLTIRELPNWQRESSITLHGEVVFPGTYVIRTGDTLSDIIERAGGLTEHAFPEGSVFTREDLRQRERQQLDELANRVESDLASLSLSDPGSSDALSIGQGLISQLRNAVPTGRFVIKLEEILAGNASADILLRHGDQLYVPPYTQEVTVLGEVQYRTSHVFQPGLGFDDYVARSGGLTRRADENRAYVVRASGEVMPRGGRRWFSRRTADEIRPGDTIVIPVDVESTRPLARWSQVTSVVYNLAIAAAAVNSF